MAWDSVNQRLPSGPATMDWGAAPAERAKVVTGGGVGVAGPEVAEPAPAPEPDVAGRDEPPPPPPPHADVAAASNTNAAQTYAGREFTPVLASVGYGDTDFIDARQADSLLRRARDQHCAGDLSAQMAGC